MIEEIIYTSAPKGLKAGSRGFCTVVSTAGMAVNTAERLESMSGYRHAFPMQDPKAPLNPVNYTHLTLRIGGRNVHVISRVADAGQDYSGRTNKLAHHLVIDDVSRFIAGPVRLMAETGVLVSQWDGNTRNVPPRKLSISMIPQSIELKVWKSVTGDSGWAGWVAEQLMKDKTPVAVIFAAGTDTFSLVREVLDLLPPTQRWSITFSTYFTKLLAGTECQLRFVLDDTPEATALRNDARARVVDLTAALTPATGGPIVAQARTGRIVTVDSPPPVQRKPDPRRPAAPSRVEQAQIETETPSDIPALRSTMPDAPVFSSPSLPPALGNPFDSGKQVKDRSSGAWKYVVGAILLVASSSLITVFVLKHLNQRPGVAKVAELKKTTSPQVAVSIETPGLTSHAAADVRSTEDTKSIEAVSKEEGAKSEDSLDNAALPDGGSNPATALTNMLPDDEILSKSGIGASDTQLSVQRVEDSPINPFAIARGYLNADGQYEYVDGHGALLLPTTSREHISPIDLPLRISQLDSVQIEFLKSFQEGIHHTNGLRVVCQKMATDNHVPRWSVRIGTEIQDQSKWIELAKLSVVSPSDHFKEKGASHVLRFEWAAAARTNPDAEFIRWCPIRISADTAVAAILLRTSHLASPMDTQASLGSKDSETYELATDQNSFQGIDLKNVQGLHVETEFIISERTEAVTIFPKESAEIIFRSSPPLTKIDPTKPIPDDVDLATILSLNWTAEDPTLVRLELKQRVRLRALGVAEKELKNLKKPNVFGTSSTEVNQWFRNNNAATEVQNLDATAELDDFNKWFEYSPAKKSAIEDHAKETRTALKAFNESILTAKKSIPDPPTGGGDSATPNGTARKSINDFATNVKPAVDALVEQADENKVKIYRDEAKQMQQWLSGCKLRSSVSASFDVDGAAPVRVYFLETRADAGEK